MQFFKRILKEPEKEPAPVVPPVERRSRRRFALGPDFPLKAVLNLDAREKSGAPMGRSRHGWNWKGRLLDCSELGARMQFNAAFNATSGDAGGLHLELEGFELFLPCRISNIKEEGGGIIFGLKYEITDPAIAAAYRQLLEIVAMGAALKPHAKSTKPDATGYLVEQYAGDRQSRLTVWREKSEQEMMAFEFLLKDCLVRGAQEQELQYLDGTDTAARPATPAKAAEIHRLFRWVTPNLPPAMPADVRAFLQYFAT
ncbi:MAG TPA: PilZ domain-containing protein [Lacunisphaera sp.]|nr:PilZ domain-containing protein [Lacunisphaera sp.]